MDETLNLGSRLVKLSRFVVPCQNQAQHNFSLTRQIYLGIYNGITEIIDAWTVTGAWVTQRSTPWASAPIMTLVRCLCSTAKCARLAGCLSASRRFQMSYDTDSQLEKLFKSSINYQRTTSVCACMVFMALITSYDWLGLVHQVSWFFHQYLSAGYFSYLKHATTTHVADNRIEHAACHAKLRRLDQRRSGTICHT